MKRLLLLLPLRGHGGDAARHPAAQSKQEGIHLRLPRHLPLRLQVHLKERCRHPRGEPPGKVDETLTALGKELTKEGFGTFAKKAPGNARDGARPSRFAIQQATEKAVWCTRWGQGLKRERA